MTLYEDDGESLAYRQGVSARTVFDWAWSTSAATLTILPIDGDALVVPASRTYELVFRGVNAAAVTVDGRPVNADASRYDPQAETLTLLVMRGGARSTRRASAAAEGALEASRDRRADAVRALLKAVRLDSRVKGQIDNELPQLLAGTASLERYPLSDAQAAALAQALKMP